MRNQLIKETLLSILLLCVNTGFCQSYHSRYIIVSFEEKLPISQHGPKVFHWLVRNDSTEIDVFKYSYLFTENFSRTSYEDCKKNKKIDPFVVDKNTVFAFNQAYYSSLVDLRKILRKNRIPIATFKTTNSGQVSKTRVYATAIIGDFCCSNVGDYTKDLYDYNGNICFPVSGFKRGSIHNRKILKSLEFNKFNFRAFPGINSK